MIRQDHDDKKIMLEIICSPTPIPYPMAIQWMEHRVQHIHQGTAPETLWLLEHPPLYTAGTSAHAEDLLVHKQFPVYTTGRGGEYTYHGTGQRVAYVMLNLKKRQQQDIRHYIKTLEQWIIDTLHTIGIQGERRHERIGIWVDTPNGEKKIAAIGVRVRRWVTYHGIALNVTPNLSHFNGIVPCGIRTYGVTSMQDLGINTSMTQVDDVLVQHFKERFIDPTHLSHVKQS